MAALANQYNHSSCSPVTQDKGHISRLDIRDPLCPRPTPHSQSVFLLPHWSPRPPLWPTPRLLPPLGPSRHCPLALGSFSSWTIAIFSSTRADPNQGRPESDPSPQLQGQCTKWDRDAEVCCGSRMGFQTVLFPRSHCACRAMTARRRRSPSRRPATQSRLAPPAPLACFPMCYLRKASAGGGGSAAENPIQDVMTTKRPKKKVIRS